MERIPRRQYTAEFKHEAVKLVLEQGVGVRETARRLDLPVGSLRNWVDAARTGKALQSETARPVTDLEAENTRLKQEVARLKMEKEILKNRPRGLPRPICVETRGAYTGGHAWTVAACFLEAYVPVKKPGPGEAADPAVVALRVTPFRKVI
jgi:transposase